MMLIWSFKVDNQSDKIMTKSYLHLVEVRSITSPSITNIFACIIIITLLTIITICLHTIMVGTSNVSKKHGRTRLHHGSAGGDLHHVQEEQGDKETGVPDWEGCHTAWRSGIILSIDTQDNPDTCDIDKKDMMVVMVTMNTKTSTMPVDHSDHAACSRTRGGKLKFWLLVMMMMMMMAMMMMMMMMMIYI